MYWSAVAAEVPPGVVTVTSTVPAEPAGAVAVIWLSLLTVKLALAVPNYTADALVKPVPVMTTEVPEDRGPAERLRPLTTGAAT